MNDLIAFIREKYFIETFFKTINDGPSGTIIVGQYDNSNNTITIDNSLIGTDRIGFVFAHELGHAILHRGIRINSELFNEFKDSEYDFVSDKHLLTNYKNWIEWQANRFASFLLIPEQNLKVHLILKQMQLGINRHGHIYLDNQPINLQDYHQIMDYLKLQFNTTKTTVLYRLQELGLITVAIQDDFYAANLRINLFE